MADKSLEGRFNDLFLKARRPYLWIVLVGAIVYIQTLFFNFTYLDDNVLILDNLFFLKNLGNIFQAFRQQVFHVLHSSAAYYRPILTISFMFDAQLSGANPFFYHFSNVAIHLITACLVYLFFTKLKYKKAISFLFSLFFVVHPVLTPAVAWIPGRNDSLLTLFFLASFILLMKLHGQEPVVSSQPASQQKLFSWPPPQPRGREEHSSPSQARGVLLLLIKYAEDKKRKHYIWHLAFFALALFTKESAIFLPVIGVVYIWLILRDKKVLNISAGLFVGWFFVFLIWYALRSTALQDPTPYSLYNIYKSLTSNLPAVFLYLGKVLFPFNLSVLPTLEDSTLLFGIAASVIVLLLLIFSKNKRYNLFLFGGLWFFIFLLPSFIRPDPNYIADFIEHRVYLPLIGLMIVSLEIDLIKNLRVYRRKTLLLALLLLSLMAFIAFVHSRNFKGRLAFWENAVQNSPNHPLAHRNLGAMYYLDGSLDKAEVEYKKSLELNPYEKMAHNNLGVIYMDSGLLEEAEIEYRKELEINPYYDKAHFNYGTLLYKKGEAEEAEKMWLKTLEINPDYVDAYRNLAAIYYQKEDLEKANYYYNEALKRGARF